MRSFFQSLLALTFLAVAVVAEPSLSPFVLHEKRDHIPVGWAEHRKHDSQAKLPLRFGLTQANLESMEEFINDVSHPDSPNYGKHWSAHEVAEKFAPSSDTIETVKAWLMQSGIDPERIRLTKAKTWIEVDATVAEAEALLNTEYHVYKHDSGMEHVCKSTSVFEYAIDANDSYSMHGVPLACSCRPSRRARDSYPAFQRHDRPWPGAWNGEALPCWPRHTRTGLQRSKDLWRDLDAFQRTHRLRQANYSYLLEGPVRIGLRAAVYEQEQLRHWYVLYSPMHFISRS